MVTSDCSQKLVSIPGEQGGGGADCRGGGVEGEGETRFANRKEGTTPGTSVRGGNPPVVSGAQLRFILRYEGSVSCRGCAGWGLGGGLADM